MAILVMPMLSCLTPFKSECRNVASCIFHKYSYTASSLENSCISINCNFMVIHPSHIFQFYAALKKLLCFFLVFITHFVKGEISHLFVFKVFGEST
jgi:hypothetical protein